MKEVSSFLNILRVGVSLCATFALLNEVNSSLAAELLKPGQPWPIAVQQTTPTQQTPPQTPGAVQRQQSDEQNTTVVQVPVPREIGLDITIVEGDGGSNIIGKKTSTKTVVEVRDGKGKLVEGALVTFTAPADGPSLIFGNGLRTATVITDASGRAKTPNVKAVNAGSFKLQVSASFQSEMSNTLITQTNYESQAETAGKQPADRPASNKAAKAGMSGTTLAIIVGVAAAGAVGIALGLGHKSSTTSAATTSATIGGAGTPSVGAP